MPKDIFAPKVSPYGGIKLVAVVAFKPNVQGESVGERAGGWACVVSSATFVVVVTAEASSAPGLPAAGDVSSKKAATRTVVTFAGVGTMRLQILAGRLFWACPLGVQLD